MEIRDKSVVTGKVITVSTNVQGPGVITSVNCGGPFPEGPESLAYDPTGKELVVMVNKQLTRWKKNAAADRWVPSEAGAISALGSHPKLLGISSQGNILLAATDRFEWIARDGKRTQLADNEGALCDEIINERNLCACLPSGGVLLTDEEMSPGTVLLPGQGAELVEISVQKSLFGEICVCPSGRVAVMANKVNGLLSEQPYLDFYLDVMARPVRTQLSGIDNFGEINSIAMDRNNVVYFAVWTNDEYEYLGREVYAAYPLDANLDAKKLDSCAQAEILKAQGNEFFRAG
eukprot:3157964-Prymnesium_polylepis.1